MATPGCSSYALPKLPLCLRIFAIRGCSTYMLPYSALCLCCVAIPWPDHRCILLVDLRVAFTSLVPVQRVSALPPCPLCSIGRSWSVYHAMSNVKLNCIIPFYFTVQSNAVLQIRFFLLKECCSQTPAHRSWPGLVTGPVTSQPIGLPD